MRQYKISIIMPNLNGEKYIASSIDHFIAQEYSEKELIIVDGKSIDCSHNIIQSYSSRYQSIRWVKYMDRGPENAFNVGLGEAAGDIIGFSGSDDLLEPGILQRITAYANQKEFDAVYFNAYNFFPKENKKVLWKCPNVPFTRRNLLRYGSIVGLQDIFFKRKVYDMHTLDEQAKYASDYEFFLRISSEPYTYLHVPEIATTNIMDNNISSDANRLQLKKTYEIFTQYARWYERPFWLERKIRGKLRTIAENLQI